jgi:carbamoyl-phosphate synthase large subunit
MLHVEAVAGELVGVIVSSAGRRRSTSPRAGEAGIPILGTSPDAIDLAEDRERFAALVDRLGLRQPLNGIARSARGGAAGRGADRLSGPDPAVLRAGRAGDGDRRRPRRSSTIISTPPCR